MTLPAMQETVVDGVTKYSIVVQATDENGQPILDRHGNAKTTNLVADSPAELVQKMAESNLGLERTLNRQNKHIEVLKTRRPTPAREPKKIQATPLSEEQKTQIGLEIQDPRTAVAAVEKVVQSAVPVAAITESIESASKDADLANRERIASTFMDRNPDYYPVSANNAMLNGYLKQNKLEFSVPNLEIAFAAVADKLARRRPAAPPRNAPPEDRPGNAPPAARNAPPNPGTPPAPPARPAAPAGGLSNRDVSGRPASGQQPRYTYEQAWHLVVKEPNRYAELMRDPAECAALGAALASRRR